MRKRIFHFRLYKWGLALTIMCWQTKIGMLPKGLLHLYVDNLDLKRDRKGLFMEGIVFNKVFYLPLLSQPRE